MLSIIQNELTILQTAINKIQSDAVILQSIERSIGHCVSALRAGRTIFFAGNGGSASDCQHLAAELICRLKTHRRSLRAVALTTDTSALTAIANDYGYENIFSRQLDGLSQEGDVLIAISTSGKSPNIIQALKCAKERRLTAIGLTGVNPPELFKSNCDEVISVPALETSTLQSVHITIGHAMCFAIEKALCPEVVLEGQAAF